MTTTQNSDLELLNSTQHLTDSGPEQTQLGQAGQTDQTPREIGGRQGPEPTRYGDWEKNGRCIDF